LNGRLQRIAQRITSLIALLPAALGQGTMAQSLRVVLASDQAAIPVTASAGSNLNTSSLALEATQTANGVLLGAVTEAAPATDTASSGLNGRLQRIAQRITSLIALLPSALGSGGGLKIDGSGTVLPVSLASVPALVAGSALIGKVGIDQTTPGTTNAVQANAGTNLNTSALAIETGGNLATLAGKDFAVSAKQDTGNTSLSAISASLGTASINAPETASVLDSLQRLNTKLNTLTRQAMPPRLPAKLKPNTTLLLIGVR
jgi:hypothetical protein